MGEKSREAGLGAETVIGDGVYSVKDNLEYTETENIKLASK